MVKHEGKLVTNSPSNTKITPYKDTGYRYPKAY